jgi:ribosomal protein S4
MTKIITSRYSLLKNFEEDITGLFLFKLKRRDITRKLFAFSKTLNKVEPIRLTDLLISKKRRIKSTTSFDTFKFRKIKFFYGFLFGKTKKFNKFNYKKLQKHLKNRLRNSLLFFESRLDIILVRLHLFISVFEARIFIKKYGVLVNNKIIKKFCYQLIPGDLLSLTDNTRLIFKKKLYMLLKAKPVYATIIPVDLVNRELITTLTIYTWLFKRALLCSPFFTLGFPRYFEVNMNTMEFYFYGITTPKDISYPFKTSLLERIYFFNNYI